MKKNISFKMWLTVFFGGIWQFIRNIFSWKNKTPFWRVIWATITVCVLLITGMLGFAFYKEFLKPKPYEYWYGYDPQISADFKFRNNGYNEGTSFIYDSRTKKKVLTGIDWIARSEDGDSLIVVAKGGKRGFVNRYTGKVAIPFKYNAAWSFTDGVAGVCEGDSVYFIDHSGKPINGTKFKREMNYDSYVYHGDYAAIKTGDMYGLIDRNGKWVLEPEYENIQIGPRNMWAVYNNKWGVVGSDGKFKVPCEFEEGMIHSQSGITVILPDHTQKLLSYEGEILEDFVVDEVFNIDYYSDEFDEEGSRILKSADLLRYEMGIYCGLMDRDGKPVTPPLYSHVHAAGPDIYECQIPGTDEYILLNGKGEKIN